MACCQVRSRQILLTFTVFLFYYASAKSYTPVLKDLPSTVFMRHLKVSRHHPLCVVFRKNTGVGSKIEKTIHKLWQNKVVSTNYSTWELGSFDLKKDRLPSKQKVPNKLPSVRCYLGETSPYSYRGKADRSGVSQWLLNLASLHVEQSEEVTPELLKTIKKKFKIILMAFPDGPRHHEVEDMVYELAAEQESCKALAVHLSSTHVRALRDKYKFSKYPSVVVIHNKVVKRKGVKRIVEDFRVFSQLEVNRHVLEVYMMAYSIPAPFITFEQFENLYYKNESRSLLPRPLLVCYYAHWTRDVKGYLYGFNSTISQYRQDRVRLAFGFVDLSIDDAQQILQFFIPNGAERRMPFLVLYYLDPNDKVMSAYIHTDRPYPWVMFDHIKTIEERLVSVTRVKQYTPPWGTVSPDQFSSVEEGPYGSLCTPWSSNLTDNTPIPPTVFKKVRVFVNKTSKLQIQKGSWHDKFDTDSIERQLSAHEGIPLLTEDTWTKVVEKSHAPRHIFYKAGKWAGEVTKVSMVVFIMADCRNCQRNNQTFKDIQKAVSHIDGGAMYYVNCTAEKELCATHNIRGYPIIAAYRGLGWMDNAPCLSARSKSNFKKYVRLDYHGVLRVNFVMEWFSNVAGNAVKNKKMDPVPIAFNSKDVKLVSTLIPMPPGNTTGPVYGYKCLRLLCERLYSLLDCYTQYSDTVSEMDYDMPDLDLYVAKVELYRRDGVSAVLMRSGQSLQDTLEDMTNTRLHALHSSHSYGLTESQTCEEDAALCTDILTEFILDHSRLPVTSITSDYFHTISSSLKEGDLPILMALAHGSNITASASFFKNLTKVAYEVYNSMTVMTLNVDKYAVWATKFVPKLYGHRRVWKSHHLDPLSMYSYPRLCIVRKSDHSHAALYPPPTEGRQKTAEDFWVENIMEFVNMYLTTPESVVIEMEEF